MRDAERVHPRGRVGVDRQPGADHGAGAPLAVVSARRFLLTNCTARAPQYLASALCPANCGSNCRYGCLVCADSTFAGFYGATCNAPPPAGVLNVTSGSLLAVYGVAATYNGVLEWGSCVSTTPVAAQCSAVGPFPAGPANLTGAYLASASCPANCGACGMHRL